MFTVLSITNNKKILNTNLNESLKFQNHKLFKRKFIDGKKKKISIPNELNKAINNISTKYVLICHQDVSLIEKFFFEKLYKNIKSLENRNIKIGIIGFAGIDKNFKQKYSLIDRNEIKFLTKSIKEIIFVDECCFLLRTELIKKLKFNENLSRFHMYSSELSFRLLQLKYKNYISSLRVNHNSNSTNIANFFNDFKKLKKIYGSDISKYFEKFHSILEPKLINIFKKNLTLRKFLYFFYENFFFRFSKIDNNLKDKKVGILINDEELINKKIKIGNIENSFFSLKKLNIEIFESFNDVPNYDVIISKKKINLKRFRLFLKDKNYFYYKKIKVIFLTKNSDIIPSCKQRFFDFKEQLQKIYDCKMISFTSRLTDTIKYKNTQLGIFSLIVDYFKFFPIFLSLKKYDIIVIHFGISPYIFPIYEFLIYTFFKHKKIIYDADDLNFINIKTKEFRYLSIFKQNKLSTEYLIKSSDKLIFGNKFLKNYFRKYKIKSFINLTPGYKMPTRKKINKYIIFGFIGFQSAFDRIKFLKNSIIKILNKYDYTKFLIIGSPDKFISHKRCIYLKYNSRNEKQFYEKIHVGLNPLENNIINKYKSAGKLIRYINSNTYPISSPIGICKDLTLENHGSIVKNFSNKNWYLEISRILSNKKKLKYYLKNNKFTHFGNKKYLENLTNIIDRLTLN